MARRSGASEIQNRPFEIMKTPYFTVRVACLLAVGSVAPVYGQAVLTAVGTYDPTTQTNNVDFNAAEISTPVVSGVGSSATAMSANKGNGASYGTTVANSFNDLVATAFGAGNGGVASFDGGTAINPLSSFSVSFAAGAKSLPVTNGPGGQGPWQIMAGSANRVPVSGASTTTPAFLGKGTGNSGADFDFQFGAITGGATDEKVTAVGITWCSRSDGNATVTATAYLADVSGTAAGTISSSRTVSNSAGGQDTFFGFKAPAGYQITRLLVDSSGGFSSVDDLGFVTAVVTPPPQAPVIAADLPLATNVLVNGSVNLSVTLQPGTYPLPTWQWEVDYAPQDGIFANVPPEAGGNDATLTFISDAGQEGTYRVTATNSQGTDTSTECVFTVTRVTPAITTDLLPLYEPLLATTQILAVGTNANIYPAPAYQWTRNGSPVPPAAGGNDPSLILDAGPASDGVYQLVISNSQGTATSAAATVAHLPDTDGDGLADRWETNTGTFVSSTDTGSNPNLPDTDGDTIDDGTEVLTHRTNPNRADTDGDGLRDDAEISTHLTNPLLGDTDLDGTGDGAEITAGKNPLWFANGLDWRPGGLTGGPGTWNTSASDWLDGEIPPGTTTTWTDGKAALFGGNLAAAVNVLVDGARTANHMVFSQSGNRYNFDPDAVNPGSLTLTGRLHLGTNDAALRLPVTNSTGLAVHGNHHGNTTTASGALLVYGDQTATLSGPWTIKPGAMLRPDMGGVSLGTAANLTVESGGMLRLFSDEADTIPQTYAQDITLAGYGFVSSGTTAGAILFRDGHPRTFTGSLLLAADTGIKMDAGTWIQNGPVGLASGVTGTELRIAQNGTTATLNGAINLGTGRLVSSSLPLAIPHATAAGGTIVLNNGTNAFAGMTATTGTIRADVDGAIPDGIDIVQNGGTINLNGFGVNLTTISGSGGTLATGAAALIATSLTGSGGQISVGTATAAGTFTLDQSTDTVSARMIQVADFAGNLFTKKGAGKLTLTGNNNQGGNANGLWVIEQGVLELAANQPQFGTIRAGGTVRVKPGASVRIAADNALHGYDNGGTRYILETGATLTTGDGVTTHATNLTLEGGTLASGAPNALYGSYDLLGNATARMIVSGATTSTISAADMRPSRAGGYEIEVLDGASSIDLEVTGSFNAGPLDPGTSLPYNGTGGLIKSGPGTMRLAAGSTHTYQGPTTVGAGTLMVDGALTGTSGITLAPAATLAGSGTVSGLLSGTGTVAPGSSTGTLTVTGDADLTGATLAIEIDGSQSPVNDLLAVSGHLDLDGATLNLAITGTLTQPVYVIASYGTLGGETNLTVNNLPATHTLDFHYNGGNQIALVGSGPIPGYESWAAANNITGGPNGDSDNDGIRNLMEYALNTNLNGSDGSMGSIAGGVLAFSKRPEAVANGDLTYVIETSTTLAPGSWNPVVTHAPGNTSSTITYALPTGQGRIFARLVVTLPSL
jgi:autotransporter-associated beta strand protein